MFAIVLAPVLAMMFMAAAFAVAFTVKSRRSAVRKSVMRRVSGELNTPFSEKDPYGLMLQLKRFELFRKGVRWIFRSGRIENVLRSTVGDTEVFLFDYSYVVSRGNHSRRISQTVFFANDKNWYLPNFKLKPERWWHKALRGLGMDGDIAFDDNPEFSEKFWVKSEFEDIVRKQFTPQLQHFLLQKPPVHLEGENYYLTAYKPGRLLDVNEAQEFFSHCCELVQLLKSEGRMELLDLAELKQEAAPEVVPPTPLERS